MLHSSSVVFNYDWLLLKSIFHGRALSSEYQPGFEHVSELVIVVSLHILLSLSKGNICVHHLVPAL